MGTGRRGGLAAFGLTMIGALMLAAAGLAERSAPAFALTNCTIGDFSLDGEEQAFLTLINGYRAQNGLSGLGTSTNLNRAAAWMSNDMGVNARFSHTDSLGRAPYTRAQDCGYPAGAGENIAAGTAWADASAVFEAWKASPGHNSNMLTSYYQQIGIARVYVNGSPYGWYWTTNFGATNDGTGSAPPTQAPTNTPTAAAPTNTPTTAPATNTPTRTPTPAGVPTQVPTQAPTTVPTVAPTQAPTQAPPTTAPTNTPAPSSTQAPTSTPATAPQATATPVRTTTPESGAPKTPVATPAPAASMPLSPGANLVAWPSKDVTPAQALGSTAANVSIVYAWDEASGTWKRYGPGLPGFLNNLSLLKQGQAYWVIAKTGGHVPIGQ